MDITPFDFREKVIDSALRFSYFIVEKAKRCKKQIQKNFQFQGTISLLREISRHQNDFIYIRQAMDLGKLEGKLAQELNRLSKDCSKTLALYSRDRIQLQEKDIIYVLDDIISLEKHINDILKKFRKQVRLNRNRYYAGLDGGGTKTVCVISKADGRIIGKGRGGPADVTKIGAIRTMSSLITALKNAVHSAGLNYNTTVFERICAGFVIRSKAGHKRANALLTKYVFDLNRHNIIDAIFIPDDLLAWYGALKGKPGIIIIGGTGHVVYGYNPLNRKEANCFTYGDKLNVYENVHLSGRYLSYHAAKIVMEKRRKKSLLKKIIIQQFNEGKIFKRQRDSGLPIWDVLEDICQFFKYKSTGYHKMELNEVPQLGYVIYLAAKKGDSDALKLIEEGSHTMAKYVSFVAEEIGLHNKNFKIGLIGSVINNLITKTELRKTIPLYEPKVKDSDIVRSSEKPERTALKIAINNIRFY